MNSLLCEGLHFLMRVFNFLGENILAPRTSCAEAFCPRYLLTLQNFNAEEQDFTFRIRDTGNFFLRTFL